MKLELFPSPSPCNGMPRLPRKQMLDTLFTIAFLLLASSHSRDADMYSPAFLVVALG